MKKIYKIPKGGYVIENASMVAERISIYSVETENKGDHSEHVFEKVLTLGKGEKSGILCPCDCIAEIEGEFRSVEIHEKDIKIISNVSQELATTFTLLGEKLITGINEAVQACKLYPNRRTVNKALHGKTKEIRDKNRKKIIDWYRKNHR